MEENEESGVNVPETTRRSLNEPNLEQAHDACDKAYHRSMVVSTMEGTMSNINMPLPESLSPRSYAVACTEQDDDSCTTVY